MSSSPRSDSPDALFRAIERDDTLAVRVAKEMERMIFDGQLRPGHKLLSERELGDKFGVSRTVVREAVRSLAAKGLLDVRTGSGTYVQDKTTANAAEALGRVMRLAGVAQPGQAAAIYEVRRPLEIAIAGLAAERATAEDVAHLRRLVETARSAQRKDHARYVEADVEFHVALASATHNQLFVALLNSISELLNAVREIGLAVAGAPEEGVSHHTRILDKVARHDAEGARKAMRDHMDDSERILRRAIKQLEREGRPA
jgi:GntR family transcriptional repressor for pyruvate dehydrogenase complex